MKVDLAPLLARLEAAAQGLPNVAKKRLFGCDGLFANGNIFALVWKTGRIGVRLPDEGAHAELLALPGAAPWKPSPKMTIAHWVLVPEAMHDEARALAAWVRRAHALAVKPAAPPRKKKGRGLPRS